jgi:PAS domain S-box-containing protein
MADLPANSTGGKCIRTPSGQFAAKRSPAAASLDVILFVDTPGVMPTSSNLVRLPSLRGLSWDDCRLLVESVVDYAIFMLDEQGRVATWNVGAEKIKGYTAAEIVGEHFSIFFPPEDVVTGKPAKELQKAIELGRIEDEGWRVRKDGSRFWANVITTALRDPDGNLRGFGKVTRDLSARREAEERFRQAEERFHRLVDAVTDYAIYMLDAGGHVATWNPGAERIKGYAASEIIGQHFSRFYTAEDRLAGKPERVLDVVRQTGHFEEENWRIRKDGTRFWASVVITALKGDSGNLVGFVKVTRDLTERRRAEEALGRSEERLRLLIENISDYAIYMLDPTGVVTTWNPGAERMKGYTAPEIIGRSFECFFPEEDRAAGKPAQELALALAEGRFEDEGWRVRKDGTRFWANAVLTPLRDHQQNLIGFAKITRDLTAQRNAQEQERKLLQEHTAREVADREGARLRESEQRYRELSRQLEIVFEGVADGITVQEPSGRLVFANTAAAKLCGFATAAELMATAPADVVAKFEMLDEAGKPVVGEELPARRVLAGEESASAVLCVRERATQKTWWVQLRATGVPGDDGRPSLAINIWHDVTTEHEEEAHTRYLATATAALAQSLDQDEMLAALAQSLAPGLADRCSVYSLEGGVLRHVAAAHADHRKSFTPDPAHAGGSWDVVRSGKSSVFNDGGEEVLLVPLLARGGVLGVMALVYAQPGRRYAEKDVELAEELGRRAGTALENARLYQDAQEAARAAEEAALRAEELARAAEDASRAKDEFLATVSHELRTPLNAMLGWATLLKERASDAAIKKPLEVIHRNAQAQVKIIDDILDVSRVITGKFRIDPRPADLVAIISDAIDVVRPSAEAKRIEILFKPEADLCLLVADPERLQQVIWNLLSNAIKFTDSGGRIEVLLRLVGSQVTCEVKDSGQGIDPMFLPFVFDRFRQADSSMSRRFGGLGLGLALVRHIVELHGGRVEAFSAGRGQGALFRIELPIRAVSPSSRPASSEQRPQEPTVPQQEVALSGVRILVVDDEADARELVATVLMEAGAEVETAGSAAEGFELLKRFHADVLVSDVGMPDEDGFSFIRRIRALPPADGSRIPALALTAFARESDRAQALKAGFTAHVGKPVEPEVLAAAVSNLAALRRR